MTTDSPITGARLAGIAELDGPDAGQEQAEAISLDMAEEALQAAIDVAARVSGMVTSEAIDTRKQDTRFADMDLSTLKRSA